MSAYQPQPQSQPQHQHGRSPSVSPSPSTSSSSNSNPSTPVSYHSQLRASASGTTPASSIITATATATVSATTSTTTQHRQANLLTIVGFPTGEDKRNQITQQSLFGEDKQKNLRTQKYPGEPLPLFLQVLGPAKKSEPRRLLIRLTKTRNPDARDGQGGASGSSEAGSSSNWRSSSSPSVVASASMTATVNSSNPSTTAAVAPGSTSFSSPSVGLSSSLHRATLRSSTSSSASSWESDGPQVSQDSPVPGLGMGLGLNSELSEGSTNVASSSTLIPSSSSVVIEDEVNIYIAMEKANIHRDDDWVQIPVKKWIKSIIRPPAGAIRINDCHRPTKAPIWYQWHEGPSEYYDLQLFIANSQGIMDGFTIHASFEEHQNVDVTRQRYQSNRTNNKLKTSGDRMGAAFSARHSPYPIPDHSSIANEFGSGGPPGSASISDDFYDEMPNSGLMPHPHSISHTTQHFPSQPLLSHSSAGQYHAVPYAPHTAVVPGRDPHDPMLSMDRDIREITMSYLSPSEWPPGFERLMQDSRTVLLHPARHPNEKDLDHASIRSWAAAVVPRDLDFTPTTTRVIVGLVDSAIHMEVTAKMIRALSERYGISQNLVLMKSVLTQVNEDGLLSGRRSVSLSSSSTGLGSSASPQGVVPVEIHKILNSILSIASLAKTRNQHRFILMLPWIISGNFSSSLEKTIQYAVDSGVLVIASAGDFGGAVNVEGNNTSNGTSTWVPAGLPSVLTVGALRSDRSQWRLSNYVVGATPSGASTTSSNGFPTPDMFDPKNPAFHLEIGQLDEIVISTSIAAVLTAMKAAYLWSRTPNQGAAELRIGLRFGHTLPTSRGSRPPPFADGLTSSSSSVVPMNISTSGTELDRDAILSAKQLSPPPGHMPLLSGYGTMSILDGDSKVREVGMCMTTMALEQVNSLINYIQQHDTHLVEQSNLLGAQRTLIQLRSVLLPDFASRNNVLTHPTIPEMSIIAGDYQVTRTLATGTFATVLLCLNLRNQGYYAVKVLDKNDIIRLQHEDRVNTEKLTHSRCTHPFIVKLYGAFQDSKRLYFVMEYVPGGDLHTIIRKFNRLPPDHAKFYAVELVLAIKYLHELNIIHRDIKPENILIDAAGHIRLTDFGFAKQLNPSSGNDKSWTMCGTPEYMAPEVVLVKGHGKVADWWSFGIVIYEMLEGAPPFRADSIFEVFDQITACKLMIPQHFLAVVQDLLQRLLVPDPNKRIGLSEITLHPWFAGVDWNALLRSQQQLQQQQS